MTVICAVKEPSVGVYIGSDGRTTDNNQVLSDNSPKWYRVDNSEFFVGIAGSYRMANVISRLKFKTSPSIYELTDAICDVFNNDSLITKSSNDNSYNIDLLIANSTTIWDASSDLSPLELPDDALVAKGSGGQYALGAMSVCSDYSKPDMLKMGIKAACLFDHICGGKMFVHLIAK
jgi:ATP-dependent protease HslVU (ClpYQ) peptidase subunit